MNQGTKSVKRSCRFFLLDYIINFGYQTVHYYIFLKTKRIFGWNTTGSSRAPKHHIASGARSKYGFCGFSWNVLGGGAAMVGCPLNPFSTIFELSSSRYLNISVTKLTQNFVKLHKKRNRCAKKLGCISKYWPRIHN